MQGAHGQPPGGGGRWLPEDQEGPRGLPAFRARPLGQSPGGPHPGASWAPVRLWTKVPRAILETRAGSPLVMRKGNLCLEVPRTG